MYINLHSAIIDVDVRLYIPVIYIVYLFHDCVVQDCWIFLFMYNYKLLMMK